MQNLRPTSLPSFSKQRNIDMCGFRKYWSLPMTVKLWMVYTFILIHRARMKTKGKELVEISDICDEFYSCSQYQYLLGQHDSNFIEVKIYIKKKLYSSISIKSYTVNRSWMIVNKISTLVLKPFIYSDSLKLTEIQCDCWRICNQNTL